MWIRLYNLHGKADLANVLTHELTHVAFNQAGIGYKLPLWLNEGTSWYTGLAAQESVNPAETKLEVSLLILKVKQPNTPKMQVRGTPKLAGTPKVLLSEPVLRITSTVF